MRNLACLAATALLAACAHETQQPQMAARPIEPGDAAVIQPPEAPPQYVVGDPARPSPLTLLPIGDDAGGVIIEGQRFTLRPSGVRAAIDVADTPIQSAWHLPARLGGGYLFRARNALYRSDTFEGLLRPVVALPSDVAQVSFGPSAALVRADSGERWMIDLGTGKRLPIVPPGLLDVAALDDGRAAALVEGGALLVSGDGGAHWSDVSSRLRSPAKRLVVDGTTESDPGLWIETQAGQGARVMPGARVAEYDAVPPAPLPLTLRAKQPDWREEEPPIRRAVHLGAPFAEGAALVIASGDLDRIDLVTGAVEVVAAGKVPPDAVCAGTRTADDIVFTCGRSNGTAFVVAHALERAPAIEQTFQEAGRFVVSDDGGIAFLGSCDKPTTHDRHVACVRSPGGTWQQYDPDAGTDAGAQAPQGQVVRWIPRADGGAIAVVSGIGGVSNAWGLVDARTGELHAWPTDALTPMLQNALQQGAEASRGGAYDAWRLADRTWTTTPQGTLRGWASLTGGLGAIEVGVDGSVQTSAFTFDRISGAGVLALARLKDGRVWQTVDRGATWSEVAAPSASKPNGYLDAHACSMVGCDLAQWYRIGWAATPPSALRAPTNAPPAPRLDRAPPPAMTCRTSGDAKRASAPRGERSPDDLGLGASKVGVSDANGRIDFLRVAFGRKILGSVRDTDSSDDTSPRAIVHGPATQPGDDRLVVMSFNRDAMSLVRQVAFVSAFDPLGVVRRAPLAMSDILPAARAAGISVADALKDDPVPSAVVPATPLDAGGPDDLLVQFANGGVTLVQSSARAPRPRVAIEAGRGDEWRIVSAADLDGGAVAWLEEDSTGSARVMHLGSSGTPAPVFQLDAPPSGDLYPPNTDALAVGPRGELAVLRTPSGSEPPSALDPAVVVMPTAGATALAPWSTLTAADDPACKSDPGGWRATVQAMAPWLRLGGGADMRGPDDAPMLARVRWTASRVCLEAVELRGADTTVAPPPGNPQFGTAWDQPVESWIVARFAGGAAAGRVIVLQGAEMHQPLECTLATP